jgi:hypothetical protein
MRLVDPNVLATRVAAALHKASAEDLDPFWLVHCADAAFAADREALGALSRRGLTEAQAASSPAVVARAYDLALLEALDRGAALQQVDPLLLQDLRKKREDAARNLDVFPAPDATGAFLDPALPNRVITQGPMTSAGDRFRSADYENDPYWRGYKPW